MVQKEFEFLSVNEKKGETDNFVAVQEVQVEVHSSSGSVSGSADEQRPASGADDHAEVKAELLSELKRIDGVQSLPALKDEAKRRLKQKEDQVAKDIENVKRDYTAAKFIDEVPKHTIKNGKQIDTPDWQRQILAKKRAHEAAIAEEKRLLEELEDWKTQQLPNWRRRTISKDGKDAQVES